MDTSMERTPAQQQVEGAAGTLPRLPEGIVRHESFTVFGQHCARWSGVPMRIFYDLEEALAFKTRVDEYDQVLALVPQPLKSDTEWFSLRRTGKFIQLPLEPLAAFRTEAKRLIQRDYKAPEDSELTLELVLRMVDDCRAAWPGRLGDLARYDPLVHDLVHRIDHIDGSGRQWASWDFAVDRPRGQGRTRVEEQWTPADLESR